MKINARFVATALAACLTGTFAAPQLLQPSIANQSSSDALKSTTSEFISATASAATATDLGVITTDVTQAVGSSTVASSTFITNIPDESTMAIPTESSSIASDPVASPSTGSQDSTSTAVSLVTSAAVPSSTSTSDIVNSTTISQSAISDAGTITSGVSSSFADPTSVPSTTTNSTAAVQTQSDTAWSAVTPKATNAGQGAVPTPPWAPFMIPDRGNATMEGRPFKGPTRPDCLEHPGPRDEALASTVEPSSSTGSGAPTSTTTTSTAFPSVTDIPQPGK
ncbi:hypothetical protein CVT26_001473 [Gymnopilus dilepis]|uniref:Uncharacterized protein n=1 Tax=Gymnopilus dilepis TaxID=231916 RepID=A0A409WBC3_9AGAR|nr:hypothetical protein CVT26_001473 [Gymnopilus dilepis]